MAQVRRSGPAVAASGAHESAPDTKVSRAWARSCPDISLCASIKRWAKASATSDDDRNRPIHALSPNVHADGAVSRDCL